MKHVAKPYPPCALVPLSDIAVECPELRSALIILGHVLLSERGMQRQYNDLVRYHICRIEQLSGDKKILERIWRAVELFRGRGSISNPSQPGSQINQPIRSVLN